MHIRVIDDEFYVHRDVELKLKLIGFPGRLSCYYSADEFTMGTDSEDLSHDVIVVDYELGDVSAVESKIAEHIKRKPYGKLILCSLLPSFGSDSEYLRNHFDEIVRKDKIDWGKVTAFFSLPVSS
jgi:hypothetical protein